jgi:hypothetical protein
MRSIARIAILSAVLLPPSGTAFAAPRTRDAWHAFTANGKRYGSVHSNVSGLANGNFRIIVEFRLLLDIFAANKEELSHRIEYVVTPDYRPISITGEGRRGSGPYRVAARRRGAGLEMTATVAGLDRSRTIERADAVMPSVCLDDWLADRTAEFKSGEMQLLDDEALDAITARVKRTDARSSGSSWSIRTGPEENEQTIVLGPDGLRIEASIAGGLLKMYRCSAEQARDLTFRKLDGREVLIFPPDREVGPIDRLESLTVEVRWKDIGLDRFRLSDDRQRLVERSDEGGRYRVVVRIEPPRPVESPVRFPIAAAEFAAELGESRFIKPHDPKIVGAAREVTRGKANTLEAVRALSEWVSKYVEPAYIADTLSGPEVLAYRKGKCSEIATLFASMARAVGIPTRIVLGDRLLPGMWGGHMWNEVYVGRWISVDAGYNEVGKSMALVKFVDHDSVEGVIPLRQELPASLQIRIVDHRSSASPFAGRFKTGIEGRVYTNAELGCRMTAPAEGWTIEPIKEPGVIMVRFNVAGMDGAQIHLVAFVIPGSIEPKALLRIRRKYYESRLKGLEYLVDEACKVNGLTGHRQVLRHTPDRTRPMKAEEVVWRKGGSGYLLALSVEESAYEAIKPSFTRLLESFEDLETK